MGEANSNSQEQKRELINRVELRTGFGELREKLNAWQEGKFWEENEEDSRQEVERTPPKILEEGAPKAFPVRVYQSVSIREENRRFR